jgi:hypothetical protein
MATQWLNVYLVIQGMSMQNSISTPFILPLDPVVAGDPAQGSRPSRTEVAGMGCTPCRCSGYTAAEASMAWQRPSGTACAFATKGESPAHRGGSASQNSI